MVKLFLKSVNYKSKAQSSCGGIHFPEDDKNRCNVVLLLHLGSAY